MPPYNILVLLLHSHLTQNLGSLASFNTQYWLFGIGMLFLGGDPAYGAKL